MDSQMTLEHLLLEEKAGAWHVLAQSAGFREQWHADALRVAEALGSRPEGLACPHALFACPLTKEQVVLGQMSDLGANQGLTLHLVVFPWNGYADLGGNPFHLVKQISPPWQSRGLLEPIPCPAPDNRRRTVAEIRPLLQGPHSATLFGAAQALLDGGRLVLERSSPDTELVRSLWLLLPTATRSEIWPATFAFGEPTRFTVLVVPRLSSGMFKHYLLEEQAGDYPEGQYELRLQSAIEQDDQPLLDELFARRSYRETRRISIFLLAIILFVPLLFSLVRSDPDDTFTLPPAEQFQPLEANPSRELTEKLKQLSSRVKAPLRPSVPGALLTFGASSPLNLISLQAMPSEFPTEWLYSLDVHLGTPNVKRKGRELWHLGPVERQLRGLLYKHGVTAYDDLSLQTLELVDKLQEQLTKEGRWMRGG